MILKNFYVQELTNVTFFLYTEEGKFRKSDKAALTRNLLQLISVAPLNIAPSSDAFVIDFMAYCRKIAVKKLNLETYEYMIKHLLKLFLSLATGAGEIHIIFDNYFDDNFKTYERIRRSKAKGKKKMETLPVTILSGEQRLPVSMD